MLAQREWKASLDTAGNTEIATLPISSSKVAPKPPPLHNNHTTKAGKCFLKSQFETYRWNGHRCGLGTFKWRWSTPQHFAIREYINVASIYHNAWKDSFFCLLDHFELFFTHEMAIKVIIKGHLFFSKFFRHFLYIWTWMKNMVRWRFKLW